MKVYLLLLLSCISPLFALYNSNPAAPGIVEEGFLFTKEGWFGLKLGYQGDFCFRSQNEDE